MPPCARRAGAPPSTSPTPVGFHRGVAAMRLMAMILAAVMLLLPGPLPAAAQPAPSGPACFVENEFVAVSGTVPRRIPSLLEVELTIRNTSPIRIRVDPAEIPVAPDRGGPARPLTVEQARDAVRGPTVFILVVFSRADRCADRGGGPGPVCPGCGSPDAATCGDSAGEFPARVGLLSVGSWRQ